jgi:anti-sigma-K factor RskA
MTADANHDALREQVPLYAVGALRGAERAAVAAHVATCAACAAEVAASLPVTAALAQIVAQHDPPASLRAAILAEARPTSPAARSSPAWVGWLAAAAMLVLTAGLTFYVGDLRRQVRRLESRLAEALVRVDEGERRVAVALREAQAPLPVLTAPDVRMISLAGQTVAPSASARAYWSRSRGLVMTGANLPPLPPGRTYQLWFIRAQTPVSAGLLQPDASGQLRTVLNTPADLPDPDVLAVTQEPAGGLPAPSGQIYLAGAAH